MNRPLCTASGRVVYPECPGDSDVCIEDIAAALSRICRFNGHLRHDVEHYSVAQHSVIVSYACEPQYALAGLMHDAHEAYLADITSPAKCLLGYTWTWAERQWQHRIARLCGLGDYDLTAPPPSVRHADLRALMTERRDLLEHRDRDWGIAAEPLPETIVPMRAHDARDLFMARYAELTGE